uniref:Retrotransposon gag domain-containing protein n=1 Tax=Ananas comosus var. bracteatus TaxID=296719 RepID=A0A6V7NW71_ANACO|nr:unnamed protein product [Ananas comosus var. bracteatus]
MYRRRGRPPTRDRAAPPEMPEQAGLSAPPDLREQLAALTEATRQQGAFLQRMCETLAPPQSTAPRVPEQSTLPPTTPVAAPAAAVPQPMTVPTAPVTPSGDTSQMSEAEQERMTERLARFRRFDPPTYDGSCTKPWVVEGRVSAMEKLFDDLFIPEREQREQKFEEDMKKLQQGERVVQEYIREFTRLLNCVPFAARDEAHRVYLFE